MPNRQYYAELSLAEAVRAMAEHHYNPRTRHISRDEYELLLRAVSALEDRRSGLLSSMTP